MSRDLQQDVVLPGGPDAVYAVLTDAVRFAELTGGLPTEIDAVEGGAFSAFGGMITGRNLEMVPGERLVQAWRAGHWPAGVFSLVRFELSAHAEGTAVHLDHAAFPEGAAEQLASGWHDNYWKPLAALLG